MRSSDAIRITRLGLATLAVAVFPATGRAEDRPTHDNPPTAPQVGLIAVLGEPALDEEGSRTEEMLQDPELVHAFSTSADGLVEEALPGGGFRVHLDGRFRQVVVARLDGSGSLSVGHLPLATPTHSEAVAEVCSATPPPPGGDHHATR